MGLETDRKKDRLEKGKWKGKENWKERADIEIRIKTRRRGNWLEWTPPKRGRQKDKATDEKSNHLKGLRVSVRPTFCPTAKMNARVSSYCVCKDER